MISLDEAFVVNPSGSLLHGRLKPYHLALAARAGLNIPRTLISNSSSEIISFIQHNAGHGQKTIVKGFQPTIWELDGGNAGIFSTIHVEQSDIERSDMRSAPCIFQQAIEKRYEVRVCVYGETLFALEINSQDNEETLVDFRLTTDWSRFSYRMLDIPSEVRSGILSFQKTLGLNFGAMDFIVDKSDDWIFLETNVMGNFLWMECFNSEAPLLDALVDFLISRSDSFQYDIKKQSRLTTSDFEKSLGRNPHVFFEEERNAHVEIPIPVLSESTRQLI